jgi:menaquinone-dependent protoporphyrinogen oxidase
MGIAKPVIVVYATREGQTRKIANYVAAAIRSRGNTVDVVDAARPPADLDLSRYGGAVIAASVHLGAHEREMIDFVGLHREALDRMPTAFLSVSLSEAGAEDRTAPLDVRAKAAEDVKRLVETFCRRTGLHPSRAWPVAGALMYSEYGPLKRLVMRAIARGAHADTDVSHDHEYTDWQGLDRFVAVLVDEIERAA